MSTQTKNFVKKYWKSNLTPYLLHWFSYKMSGSGTWYMYQHCSLHQIFFFTAIQFCVFVFMETLARNDLNSLTAEVEDVSTVCLPGHLRSIYFREFVFLTKINRLKYKLVYSISRRNKVRI